MPLDDANRDKLLHVPPLSKLNPDYGFSVGRGAFNFVAGQWMTVAQRVRLNAPTSADGGCASIDIRRRTDKLVAGKLQVWVDGTLVVDADGLVFRDKGAAGVKGLHFQTFFGGMSFSSLAHGEGITDEVQ